MEIASLVIRARPDMVDRVAAGLSRLPGVEVAAASPAGRLAVTVEDRPGVSFEKTLIDVHCVEGVIAATLIYQHSEQDPETPEAQA